jgi:hypothetical protein
MPTQTTIGSSRIFKIKTQEEFSTLLSDYIDGDIVIIKPNFVDRSPGAHTDLESLRMLFESLDAKLVVTEGHQIVRCLKEGETGLSFEAEGKNRDWSWIHRGGWNYFAEHDDWGWFIEGGHWDELKRLDKRFLDEKGFTNLFDEYSVEYVNVTDEIWSERTVDKDVVKTVVDEKYGSVTEQKVYEYMPEKLYKYRGSPLISLNKFKQYATFTLKNMFGFLPDPIRCWWHGPQNRRMNQSIIDINKLYSTFFDIVGVQESLGRTPINDPDGEISIPGFKYNLHEGLNIVGVGTDRVELDTIMCGLGNYPLSEAEYLKEADSILGNFKVEYYEKAKQLNWLPMMNEK